MTAVAIAKIKNRMMIKVVIPPEMITLTTRKITNAATYNHTALCDLDWPVTIHLHGS